MLFFRSRITVAFCDFLTCLLILVLLTSGCSSRGFALPDGWVSHSFKLLEHPETYDGVAGSLEKVATYATFSDDTRHGLKLAAHPEQSFNVYLPAGGKFKFAYGFSKDFPRFASQAKLIITVEVDGESIELGSWDVPSDVQPEVWKDLSAAISSSIAGDHKITFRLDGISGTPPDDAFILAHPTVVAPEDGTPRKRIIWVAIDTLRADHLGCYGYERQTSPNIDEIAKKGTLFERCISVCPWTFPTFASMFTGRYPSISGATTNMLYLPETETTLAEKISAQDMATLSVNSIGWVGYGGGLHRGFDSANLVLRTYADVLFDCAGKWMLEHSDEDVFVFIHLYMPHAPYNPADKFFGKFDRGYKGRFDRTSGEAEALQKLKDLTDREKEHIIALYDEEILGVDEEFGDFVTFLKKHDFYKESLFIINADHGEELWDHGWLAHGHQLYDEVLHVPLVVSGPGFEKGQRMDTTCSNFDVFPTVLEWLNIPLPDNLNAKSLYGITTGKAQKNERLVLSEQLVFGVEQKGISTDDYRYIFHTENSSEELYDVNTDPPMKLNLAEDRKATSRDFRYFVKEYTLSEGSGWHLYFFRNELFPKPDRYEGTIIAPSGFKQLSNIKFDEKDVFEVRGNELHFSFTLAPGAGKGIDFSTNDESDDVQFQFLDDGNPRTPQYIFIGPEKVPMKEISFALNILDPRFGLGVVQIAPKGTNLRGCFIWGNSESLREQTSSKVDDRTIAELKSLGYLN